MSGNTLHFRTELVVNIGSQNTVHTHNHFRLTSRCAGCASLESDRYYMFWSAD